MVLGAGPIPYESRIGTLWLDHPDIPDVLLDSLVDAIEHGGIQSRLLLRATPIGETQGWIFETLSLDEVGKIRWNGTAPIVEQVRVIPL